MFVTYATAGAGQRHLTDAAVAPIADSAGRCRAVIAATAW